MVYVLKKSDRLALDADGRFFMLPCEA